jgi:hypothetical protein
MRVGGVGEFVEDGREGLLVGSDAHMAEATAALLTAPERLQAMRDHNRTTEPVTNWARVLEVTEAAYRRAGVPDVIDVRRPVDEAPLNGAPAPLNGAAAPLNGGAAPLNGGASARRFVHREAGDRS